MVYFKKLALAAVFAVAAHAAVIIDDFSVTTVPYTPFIGFVQSTVGSQTITETGIPPGNTFGGSRVSTLTATSLVTAGSDIVNYLVSSGIASYGSTNGAVGNLALLYNGSTVNLSGDGALTIGFTGFDHGNNLDLLVTATLNDANGDHSLSRTLTTAGAQPVNFDYGSFSGVPLNLGSINSIRILFDAKLSQDFAFNFIASSVPEPASFGLVGLVGALALLGYKRLGWMSRS